MSRPPKTLPKIHNIHMRSHKISILVMVPPSTTIAQLKQEALSALTAQVNEVEQQVPAVQSENDFELCKEIKEKGKPTGEYEVLQVVKQLRDYNLASYDTLYLQFRDEKGELLPIVFESPSIDDDVEEPSEVEMGTSSNAKRKRNEEDD
ncbi:hypothetical protein H0H93_013213 [Arthromyces matolae]|nr:hypothetical protein H0H93_013213 [Arthromyces matolae]